MRNLIFGIVALVLIIVGVMIFLPRGEGLYGPKYKSSNNKSQVVSDQRELSLINQQQTEIADLKRQIQECKDRAAAASSNVVNGLGSTGTNLGSTGTNSGSLSMSGPIEMNVSGDMKVTGKLTLTPTGQTGQKTQKTTAQTVVVQTKKPDIQTVVVQAPPKTVTQKVVTQTQKSGTQSVRVLPSYYYGGPDEDRVTYCLMYGENENRHLPALSPKSFDPDIIKPNHLPGGGSNFYTYPTKGFVGALGVTDQGIFFFSEKIIEDFMIANDNGLVQIKAPATGWVALDLLYDGNGYYTWSPQ